LLRPSRKVEADWGHIHISAVGIPMAVFSSHETEHERQRARGTCVEVDTPYTTPPNRYTLSRSSHRISTPGCAHHRARRTCVPDYPSPCGWCEPFRIEPPTPINGDVGGEGDGAVALLCVRPSIDYRWWWW
jgi:hypothetical protein